jgi:hypothetical protein
MLALPPQPSMGSANRPLTEDAAMRRLTPGCFGLAVLVLMAGCAGRDFTRPAPESLVLGKTTYAEINARFGSPYRESTLIKNEKTLRMASYAYATTGGDPLVSGVTPARSIDFAFLDQVLVSYQFASSFKADHTDFDENKVPSIKKGVTTRDEVIALLGPPTGMQIYPMVPGKDDTGLGWSYSQVRGSALSLKIYQKALVVSVAPAGVVTDVQRR